LIFFIWHAFRFIQPIKLKAMKPRIAFFAAASLIATGMTLASNVSFGQRAGKILAEAFEFMGPISSLVSGIVRPMEANQARTIGDYGRGIALDSVSSSVRNQAMVGGQIIIEKSAMVAPIQDQSALTRKSINQDIAPGGGNVPATLGGGFNPFGTQTSGSLLEALAKGNSNALTKERDDVWQFMNSRPGQFDLSKLMLGRTSERIDKEVTSAPSANNLTAQSLLSKNSVAPVPVPASSLVLVAGFASLFGVSLMAKKSKAKKSKKAAK
jgi:hypothetical protein